MSISIVVVITQLVLFPLSAQQHQALAGVGQVGMHLSNMARLVRTRPCVP